MKKNIFLILLTLSCIATLTGCSFAKNKEKELCNKINNDITNYKNKATSFEALANNIKTYYDEDCENNDNSDVCNRMKSIINRLSINYQLENCNTYPEGNLKDLCISRNSATQDLIDNKDLYDSSTVDILSRYCQK